MQVDEDASTGLAEILSKIRVKNQKHIFSNCLENLGKYIFLRQLWLVLGVSSGWK